MTNGLGRDYPWLWLGTATSTLGDTLGGTAYFFLALAATSDPWFAGVFGGVSVGFRVLLKLPCGYVADHWPRKVTIVAAEALSGVIVLAFAAWVAAGMVSAWSLLVLALAAEVPYSLAQASLAGTAARLVPAEELNRAYSGLQLRDHAANAAGPLVGGLLYTLGPAMPVLVDGLSFLASSAAISRIRGDLDPAPGGTAVPGLAAGMRYIRSSPLARHYLLWSVPTNVALVTALFSVLVTLRTTGSSTAVTGLVVTCGGVAGILGALLTPALLRRVRTSWVVPLLSVLMLGTGVGLALYPTRITVVVTLYSALCFALPPAQTVLTTALVTRVPASVQGRTFAALGVFTEVAVAIALPLSGTLQSLLGVHGGLWFLVALFGFGAWVAFRGRAALEAPEDQSEATVRRSATSPS